jgi:hypothetical protein
LGQKYVETQLISLILNLLFILENQIFLSHPDFGDFQTETNGQEICLIDTISPVAQESAVVGARDF